jgi:nucleoporin p58/p45
VAGLQQALWSQQQSQQLMLYTVDGRAASYETKWDELHPVSQMLLLQIEYGSLCILACCSTSAA